MNAWILILWFNNGSPALDHIEFRSRESCIVAQEHITEQSKAIAMNVQKWRIRATCVKK